jgi:hypothetical protein
MYTRGQYPIPEAKLKRALLKVLRNYRDDLLAGCDLGDQFDSGSAEGIAIDSGARIAKRLKRDTSFAAARRRIPRSKERPKEAVLQTIATAMVLAHLTGSAPNPDAIQGLTQMAGAHQAFGSIRAEELAQLAPAEDMRRFNLNDMIAAVKQATVEQLDAARDDAVARSTASSAMTRFLPYLPDVASDFILDVPDDDGITLAGALTNLTAMFNDPDAYELEMAQVRRRTVALNALVTYIEFLPAELRKSVYMTPAQFEEEFTSTQRAQLERVKVEFVKEHPAEASVLPLE